MDRAVYKLSARELEWELPYSGGLSEPRDEREETLVKDVGGLVSLGRNVGIISLDRSPSLAGNLVKGLGKYSQGAVQVDGAMLAEKGRYSLAEPPISLPKGEGVVVFDDVPKTPAKSYSAIQRAIAESGGRARLVAIAHGDYRPPLMANSLDEVPYVRENVPLADDDRGRAAMWYQLNELLKGNAGGISFSESGAAAAINLMRKVSETGLLPSYAWTNSEIINKAALVANERGSKTVEKEDFEAACDDLFSGGRFLQRVYTKSFKGKRQGEEMGTSNCLAVVENGTLIGVADKLYVTVTKNPIDPGVVLTAELHKDEVDDMALAKSRQEVEQYLDEKYPGIFEKVGLTISSTTDAIVGGPSMSGLIAATCELTLAGIPIDQSIAATGAIGPGGSLRAIGGINEKVRGWWQILGGGEVYGGVVVPAENREDLRLDREIIEGVGKGSFDIYSAEKVENLVEILGNVQYSDVQAAIEKTIRGKRR